MSLKEFKCPNCASPVVFDVKSQKIHCTFCNSYYDIEDKTHEGHDHTNSQVSKTKTTSGVFEHEKNFYSEEETNPLRVYSCESCGGEIIGDETMAATSCPYCNNNVVVSSQFSGDLKPDLIIPFKFDKDQATKKLSNFYKGRRFLPKVFKDENKINEIKGLYVPFWLFTGTSSSNMAFQGTKVRTYSDGNYRYTETSLYDVKRGGTIDFKYVPVDGSSKIEDILMESIEPFHWEEAVDFNTYYLPGFLADRYDLESEDLVSIADSRIKNSTIEAFEDSVMGYSTVRKVGEDYKLGKVDVKYALAPVWFLNTQWKGDFYTFVMNGQTGVFVGDDMPIDKGLKTAAFLKVFIILLALVFVGLFVYNKYFGG